MASARSLPAIGASFRPSTACRTHFTTTIPRLSHAPAGRPARPRRPCYAVAVDHGELGSATGARRIGFPQSRARVPFFACRDGGAGLEDKKVMKAGAEVGARDRRNAKEI